MSSREIVQRLEHEGWRLIRIRGSHRIFRHPSRPHDLVVVPHPKRDLPRGTLTNIMKHAGWSKR